MMFSTKRIVSSLPDDYWVLPTGRFGWVLVSALIVTKINNPAIMVASACNRVLLLISTGFITHDEDGPYQHLRIRFMEFLASCHYQAWKIPRKLEFPALSKRIGMV